MAITVNSSGTVTIGQSLDIEKIEKESTTGSGVSGDGTGVVPDVGTDGGNMGTAMALMSFLPANLGGDFEARLAEITDKLKATSGDNEKERVNNEMETKRLNIEENQARMEKAQKEMDSSETAGKVGDIFNKIGIAFQILGAVLMAALGAALIATGVGGPAGALMIVGAALLVVSAVNSIVAATTEDGLGIAGSIAKATGADAEEIGNADMGFGIGLGIATIAVAIASIAVSGGATAPAVLGSVQNLISIASSVTSSAAAVASAGSSISGAVGASFSKEATELQAKGKETEAFMQQLDDLIDQALTMLIAANDRFNAVMDSVTEMVQDTGNTLSNTRFAG